MSIRARRNTLVILQVAAPRVGCAELTTSPWSSVAAHSDRETQEMRVRGL
jgi:hypothetical protein